MKNKLFKAKLLAAVAVTLAQTLFMPNESYCKEKPSAFAGKVYVITGASSGFGRGVAVRLAAAGGNLALCARRANLLEKLRTEISSDGRNVIVFPADVTDEQAMEALADNTVRKFGHIDCWINNAGVGALGAFWQIPIKDQARVVDINLKGVMYGSFVAIKQFRKQGYGTLINVGSIDSEIPLAYQASYAASKAAVLSLGRSLNEELRLDHQPNIKVATIMPWAVDTPWWDHAANYSGGTPRMAMMDDPKIVVDAIVRATLHPKEEVKVGWKAKVFDASHHLLPDTTERLSANTSHEYQIKTAPPAPPTTGTIYEPMQSGEDVGGGVRERMRREKNEESKALNVTGARVKP